jgi:uncharacterized membrane protein (DUF373 family)
MPDEPRKPHRWIMKTLEGFEHVVIVALLLIMMVAILVSAAGLGWALVQETVASPKLLLDVRQVMGIFSLVFTVLIGLELLETIKTYLSKDQFHVEIVFLVAMIAAARKVILLEIKDVEPLALVGVAAVILALAAGYFLVKRANRQGESESAPRE